MEESTDPERRNGGTSHATGKHQAGGTSQPGGKHQAGGRHQVGKTTPAGPKHAATAAEATSTGGSSRGPGTRSGVLNVSRRNLLVAGGALAAAVAGLDGLRQLAVTPDRVAAGPANANLAKAHGQDLPDIQFNIGAFTAPAVTINGVLVGFPPVFTLFATATLESRPSQEDQSELARALDEIERAYQFAPQGVFAFAAYGLPYFARFPAKLFDAKVPRLLSDETRFVLEEAMPSPTDVSAANPGITKQRFNVPVVIEANDLLFTLRSDNVGNLWDVLAFLGGSDKLAGMRVRSPHIKAGLKFTSTRVMFVQPGLPRKVAEQNKLVFAPFVNPSSPMWLGFADQQVNATSPAADVTFVGADGIHLTTAEAGQYFDNGALQHLSHDILDMHQWFDLNAAGQPGADGTFVEHVQYMFRANPPPSMGFKNQFLNAGGPAFLPNVFQGAGDAARSAAGVGTLIEAGAHEHRMGHISTLQRSSRTADGRPIHVRNDGPGFDSMDVPDGSNQPKLQFMVFVPSADFFATMRRNQASLDLQKQFKVAPTDNGLERFITATRRQNFLIPPRRHRAFPFAEFERDPHKSAPAKSSPAKSSPAKSSPAPSSSGSGGSGGSGGGGTGGGGGGGGGTGGGGGGGFGGGGGGGGHGGGGGGGH